MTGSVAILPPPVAPPPRPFVRPGHARRADGGAFAHVRNDPQRYYAAAAAEARAAAAARVTAAYDAVAVDPERLQRQPAFALPGLSAQLRASC